MITVNLVPESYRKPHVNPIQQFHQTPLFFLIIGVLVAGLVINAGLWQFNHLQLGGLTKRLQQLQPKKQAVDQLRSALQEFRSQDDVLQRLSRQRRQWAKLLNILSDVVPDTLWFTDLSLEPDGLVVRGSALAHGGEEMVRIGRLVQDLKSNAAFSAVIKDIQIESIKTVQDKEIEMVEFTLTCKLTPSRLGGGGI